MPNSTATSILVLLLQARNDTRSAFSQVQGELRAQNAAVQEAARVQTAAVQEAQARQLLAVRQGAAQEQLELRQRTQFAAQQIQQGAAGTSQADRQAAAQRVQMLQQDAAQEALLLRQATEQRAQAIRAGTADQQTALRATTQAQAEAARAQSETVMQAARDQAQAQGASASEQVAAVRVAAEQMSAQYRLTAEAQVAAVRDAAVQAQAALAAPSAAQVAQLQADTDAQVAAVRLGAESQVQAVQEGLAAQIAAQRTASMEQIALVRAQAADEAAALRAGAAGAPRAGVGAVLGGALGRVPVVGGLLAGAVDAGEGGLGAVASGVGTLGRAFGALMGPVEMVMGPLGRFAAMGLQMTGWLVGYQVIEMMATGLGHLASGLVTANASFEQYNMTLQAIYGSSQAAGVASAWVDQFAEKTPFTREDTRAAALTIASLGDNVAQVLPAIGNLSAIMGVDLPRGAQAFADAQQGRFEMLMMTLRTSKEELVKYGLQLDSSGHVLNNSFVPAFEKFVAARYPNAMALQMQTFNGSMSNVQDAFQLLQRTMGQPLFEVLKTQLSGVFAFLSRPDVEAWAARAGTAIGHAASGMIAWVGRLIPYFLQLAPIIGGALGGVGAGLGLLGRAFEAALPYVVGLAQAAASAWRGAQPAIQSALAAIGTVLTTLWTGLATTVLPVVGAAIATLVGLWQRAQPLIAVAIAGIMAGASALGTFLHDTVFPAIGAALQVVATWWQQHAQAVATVLGVIIGAVVTFVGNLGTDMRAGFDILHGIWLAGWGLLSGVVGMALDLITGNWTAFGKDLSDMSTQLADGIVRIFEGMLIKTIDLIAGLAGPINMLEHALYGATKPFADEMYGLSVIIEVAFLTTINKIIGFLNTLDTMVMNNPVFNFMGLKKTKGPLKPIAMPSAAEIRKNEQDWTNTLSLGFRPGVDLTFNVDPAQAVKDAEARSDAIIADIQGKPNPFTGIVTHYGDTTLADKQDPHFWDKFMAGLKDLKAQGITLPDVTLKDLYTLPNVDLTPPGADLGADRRSQLDAAKAAKDAATRRLDEDRAAYDLYLMQGHVTLKGVLDRVRTIIKDERALPADARPGRARLALDALNLTRQGYEKVLAQLREHLDVDIKNHVDQQTLLKEENAYLKLLAQEPGVTPDDVKAARQAIDASIGVTTAKPPHVDAYKQAAFDLARGAGYGQTTVTMGPVRDQLIAQLQAQLRELKAQNAGQQKTIAALEAQLVELHRASGLLDGIFQHTAGTQQATQQTARHTQPRPTGGAHGFSQRTGMPVPV